MSDVHQISLTLDNLHPAQQQVLNESKRFNVLKCGRRWGKTKLAEDLLLSPDDPGNGALNGFPVAYFAPTYKMLMETWRQMLEIVGPLIRSKNEQEKRIELFGGGSIDMWSLEEPNNARGHKYKRVVIDECEYAPKFEEAWTRVIRAELADLIGDAWFLSTPQFGSTYFKKLAKLTGDKWAHWTFTTYHNPYIDPAEIDEARQQLDEATFRCEFLAEDVSLAVNKWIYSYDSKLIVQGLQAVDGWPIILSFDFNVEPIVALAGQVSPMIDRVLILDEFRLLNSDIDELCTRIITKYPDRMLKVTGDPSGNARTALKKDLNYYKEIQRVLKLHIGQFNVQAAHPPVKSTRVLCNSLLQRHGNYFFSDRVPYLILDIEECEVDAHGLIDKTKDKHQSHLLDAWRYFNWTFLRQFLNLKFYE